MNECFIKLNVKYNIINYLHIRNPVRLTPWVQCTPIKPMSPKKTKRFINTVLQMINEWSKIYSVISIRKTYHLVYSAKIRQLTGKIWNKRWSRIISFKLIVKGRLWLSLIKLIISYLCVGILWRKFY